MGWSTSVIVPPDGAMGEYLANLERLLHRDDAQYLPTHGPAVTDPKPLVAAFIQHRREREAQLLGCLSRGVRRIADAVEQMYADVPRHLHPAAARSVFAHMLHLHEQGRVKTHGEPSLDGDFVHV
jgi:glyoxylase-like metal-dependent hydrolase (beta-lactamase superfamily II)